jgi:hypothetical protein
MLQARFMFVLKWTLPRGDATVEMTESEIDSFLVHCDFRTCRRMYCALIIERHRPTTYKVNL